MSNVDDRIVRMQFDNSGFEAGATKAIDLLGKLNEALKFDDMSDGLGKVRDSIRGFNMSNVSDQVESCRLVFSKFDAFTFGVITSLGRRFEEFANKTLQNVKNTMIRGAKDGFGEYEQQINSIQTIAANSGEEMSVITESLDKLNEYADKTVYKFGDMTSAIGRFTAAGIGVKDSTAAIQGFANAAALAGAGPAEMSRGIYQLSQAMSAGVVKLQDWKSIENASIDTAQFREVIITTAKAMGVTSDSFNKLVKGETSFRESLKDGWLTAEVMQNALENLTMSTRDFDDQAAGMEERLKTLTEKGYSEDVAKKLIEIANAADDSAREVRTWTQLLDTMGEAIGTGWADTWKIVLGGMEDATVFFTTLSQRFEQITSRFSKARNDMLKEWANNGGRDSLIGIVFNLIEAIDRPLQAIGAAFNSVFGVSGQQLAVITENIALFTEKLVMSEKAANAFGNRFAVIFSIFHSVIGVVGNLIRAFVKFAKEVKTRTSRAWEPLIADIQKVIDTLAETLNGMHAFTDGVISLFGGFVRPISRALRQVIYIIDSMVKGLLDNSVIANLGRIFLAIEKGAEALIAIFLDVFSIAGAALRILNPFINFISYLGGRLLGVLAPAMEYVAGLLSTASWEFGKFTIRIVQSFNLVENVLTEGVSIVKDFITAFINVFKESSIFQGIVGIFNTIKNALVNLMRSSSIFRGGIETFILNPLRNVYKFLKGFGKGDGVKNRVEFFENALRTIGSTITGPFSFAFGLLKKAFNWLSDRLGGPITSGLSKAKELFDGLISGSDGLASSLSGLVSSGFSKVAEFFSGFSITNPFAGMSISDAFSGGLQGIADAFGQVSDKSQNAKKDLKKFTEETGKKPKGIKAGALGLVDKLKSSFSKLIEYFRNLKSSGKSFTRIVATVFSDVYKALRRWINSIADGTSGFGSILAKGINVVLDNVEKLPQKLIEFFNGAKKATDDGVKAVGDSAEKFKNDQKSFWENFFGNLPTIDTIAKKLGDFFASVKDRISAGVKSMFGASGSGSDASLMTSSMANLFDFSSFKIVLPDFATPFGDMMDQFGAIIDKFPTEKVDAVLGSKGYLTVWGTSIGKFWALVGLNKWLGSLTTFNRGLGAEGQGIGDFFTNMPKAITDGMQQLGKAFGEGIGQKIENAGKEIRGGLGEFAKGFRPFQQSKAKSFLQIAGGILVLAGALWVLAQIPADDLERSAEAMLKLGVCAGALIFFAAWLSATAKLDLNGVGAAMAGLGVGMLGMAGAIWVFTQVSKDPNVVVGMNNFRLVLEMLVGAISVLLLMAAAGGNLNGVAAVMIGLTAAIGLSLGAILLLGLMPTKIFIVGSSRIKSLGLFFVEAAAFLSLVSGLSSAAGGSMLGAIGSVLGLVAVITLAIVPLTILGVFPTSTYIVGVSRLKDLAVFFTMAAGFMSLVARNGIQALLASVALVPIIAAITLAAVPIMLLGVIPPNVVDEGYRTMIDIVVLFGAIVSFFSLVTANLLGIAGAAIGMTLMMVPITMMTVIIGALSYIAHKDMNAIKEAVRTLGDIVLMIGGMALIGVYGGGGLIVLSVGITTLAASLILLGVAVGSLDVNAMLGSFNALANGIGEIAWNAIYGFINIIAQAPFMFMDAAIAAGQSFLEGLMGPSALNEHSPSKATEEAGENAIEGFINGIGNKLSEMLGSGEDSGGSFLDGISQKITTDLPNLASEALANFIDNIDTEQVREKGENITAGLLEGIKGAAWESLTAIPGQIFDTIAGGIKSFFGIQSPSTEMKTVGENVVLGLSEGLGEPFDLAEKASALGNIVLQGVTSLPGLVVNTAKNAAGGFVEKIGSFVGTAGTKAKALANGASEGLKKFGTGAKTAVEGGVKNFISGISGKANAAKTATTTMVNGTKGGLTPAAKQFKNQGTAAAKGFTQGISSAAGAARGAARNLVHSSVSGLAGAGGYNAFYRNGAYVAQGFVHGMRSQLAAVRSIAAQMMHTAAKANAKTGQIKSPSRVFMRLGKYVGQGFAIGMEKTIPQVWNSATEMAEAAPDAFSDTLKSLSINMDDLLETDYNPVITPVIDPTQFDSDMSSLTTMLNNRMPDNFNVGAVNYSQQFASKLADYADVNKQAMEAFANNAIDYDQLGVSVANALIRSGVHVEMDGGQLMGYLAGEIRDARRMYG